MEFSSLVLPHERADVVTPSARALGYSLLPFLTVGEARRGQDRKICCSTNRLSRTLIGAAPTGAFA